MSRLIIGAVRDMLGKALSNLEWTVYTYKPDDVNEVPCYVVDRPTLAIDVQLYTVTCSVICVGRRLNDEDAQRELDDGCEDAMLALRGPDVDVSSVDPITVTIADLIHPGYRIDCAIGRIEC
jgi:hypothetical protein